MIPNKNWSTMRKLMLLGGMAGGKLVEDTAIGNPLTFITDVSKPLKSLLIPFTPVQSGTGDPSPENIRPIVPWDGLKVFGGGKNLLDITKTSKITPGAQGSTITISDGVISIDAIATSSRTFVMFSQEFPAGTYTIQGKTSGASSGLRLISDVEFDDSSYNSYYSGYIKAIYPSTGNLTFILPSAGHIGLNIINKTGESGEPASAYDIQLEAGSTASAYTPFVPITETDIPFASPVYGGTLDVVSGVLTVEFVGKSSTWGEIPKGTPSQTTGYVRGQLVFDDSIVIAGQGASNRNSFCNVGKYVWEGVGLDTPHFYPGTISSVPSALIFLHEDTPAETVVQAVCKLATPIEIQLTPAQITALLGDNTIWSDANGEMTAVYLKKG